MAEQFKDDAPAAPATWQRLDRFLLWLMAGELGYLFVALLLGLAALVAGTLAARASGLSPMASSLLPLAVVLPLLAAYLGNLVGAFWSLVLMIRGQAPAALSAAPGILLNLILVGATSWVYLLAVLFLSMTGIGPGVD